MVSYLNMVYNRNIIRIENFKGLYNYLYIYNFKKYIYNYMCIVYNIAELKLII